MHLLEAYRAVDFFQANPPPPGSIYAIEWWALLRELFYVRHGVYPVEDLCLIVMMTALAKQMNTPTG